MMLDRFHTDLQAGCSLDPGQPILVGVSGGPDSLCLLDALHRLAYPLVIAHVDHGLRSESGAEAEMVAGIARQYGLPFELGREDVKGFSEARSLSIEEAARTLRYRFLFEQARRYGAQAVAVGHTADDQVETLLMHLLRGSGLSGLRGMSYRSRPTAWSEEIPLVRPLLGVWRAEIVAYLAERGLKPAYDSSNLDQTYYRNRLRHDLLPFLEGYNPQVRRILWRTAQVLGGDYEVLMQVVAGAWQRCRVETGSGHVSFAVQPFRQEALAVQRHLLRQVIAHLRPDLRDVGFLAVERGLALLAPASGRGQADLAGGLILFLEGDRAWVAGQSDDLPDHMWPQVSAGEPLRLTVPGSLALQAGWELRAERAADAGAARKRAAANTDPYQAWFDARSLRLPLEVGSRRPGDRFRPFGMDGHSIKLSDYMINVKVPQRARDRWPLVRSGQEILWVPGFRQSHASRLTEETQEVVQLRLYRHGRE